MNLLTYRGLLFSSLFLVIALLIPRSSRSRPHPFCEKVPSLCKLFFSRLSSSSPIFLGLSVVSLTQKLVFIDSPSGFEAKALNFAATILRENNFSVQTQSVRPLKPGLPARVNVVALRHGVQIKDVRVLLFTHLDVVPGAGNDGDDEDGVLKGRGVVDAKGQAAGMMDAMGSLKDDRVGLLLVCGEETDHAGVIEAGGLGFRADVILVNGEPTESKLGRMQRGMQKVLLTARGKSAHSGYPEYGENAVDKLVDVIVGLRGVDWGEVGGMGTSMNVGLVRGGSAANVVPDEAVAEVMFRVGGGSRENLVKKVVRVAGEGDVDVEIGTGNDAVRFLVPGGVGGEFGSADVGYNTDVAYWKGGYGEAVLFGAGSILTAHSKREWIRVEELEALPGKLVKIVKEILERF